MLSIWSVSKLLKKESENKWKLFVVTIANWSDKISEDLFSLISLFSALNFPFEFLESSFWLRERWISWPKDKPITGNANCVCHKILKHGSFNFFSVSILKEFGIWFSRRAVSYLTSIIVPSWNPKNCVKNRDKLNQVNDTVWFMVRLKTFQSEGKDVLKI